MEFDYFVNNSALSGIEFRDRMYYNSSSSTGNFDINAGGNFSSYDIVGSESDTNFTAILTFNKSGSGAQIILSNHYSAGGFTFGLDAGNFLYVDCNYPSNESYSFRKVNLSSKNCIALRRSENTFSVVKYDPISRVIESSEAFIFSPNQVLNAGGLETSLAGNSYGYSSIYGVNYFNGTVDQFVYCSGSVEDSYLLDFFSGFLPLTKTPSVSSTYSLSDESYRFPDSLYSGNYSFISTYFNSLNTGILSNLGTGRWIGSASGIVNSTSMTGQVSYSTGINSCYGTGVYYSMNYSGVGGGGSVTFTDTISVVRNSSYSTISHNVKFLSGGNYYRVDYDASYSNLISTSYSWTEDSGYYSGFRMDGIVSDRVSSLALGHDTGVAPTGFNLQGLYDSASDLFYVPGFNTGAVYLTGRRYLSGYTVSDSLVDILTETENGLQNMVADNSTGVVFLNSGVTSATGKFYPGSAQAFSGVYPSGRMKKGDYKETSLYHLYHGAKVQGLGSTLFYDY